MNDAVVCEFVEWIAATLGLRIRNTDQSILWQKMTKRKELLGLSSLQAYIRLLMSGPRSSLWEAEWRELVGLLTVTESYFFRDQGQFSLLRQRILPELIQNNAMRSLRLWSAGCSTGEEAYSLAILAKELIPSEAEWTISVLGTDINAAVIEQAKQGIYSEWSFRSVEPEIRKQYFRQYRGGWEIDPQVRKMVTFQVANLIQDPAFAINRERQAIDLILCRNVFIYFDAPAIASVLNQFYQALSPTGYLITGHTELHGQDVAQFQPILFPESVVYRRRPQPCSSVPCSSVPLPLSQPSVAIATHLSSPSSSSNLPSTPSLSRQSSPFASPMPSGSLTTPPAVTNQAQVMGAPLSRLTRHHEVTALIEQESYADAIHKAQEQLGQEPIDPAMYSLMAEAYANLGDYSNATQACQQALHLDSFALDPYYLLAQIAEEQGDLEGAKLFLKRIIYLAPNSVRAYVELGALYEQEGNNDKAKKNWRSALELLQRIPSETKIMLHPQLVALDIKNHLEKKLNGSR